MLKVYDATKEISAWVCVMGYATSATFCMVALIFIEIGLYFKGMMYLLSSSLVIVSIGMMVFLHLRALELNKIEIYR